MTRPSTYDGPATLFDNAAASKLERAFQEFHAQNPQVYATLKRLAVRAKQQGQTRTGIGMLWEVMRWELTVETRSGDNFRLNNNHRSRYARLLMEQEPELAGIFATRELRGG